VVRPAVSRGLALVIALTLAGPAQSGSGAAESEYREVREKVSAFRKDAKKRKYRHHYERLVRRMEKLALEHSGSGRADDALYVAAQLQAELATVSRLKKDHDAAAAAYAKVAENYPKSNLADDALFEAATIRLEKRKDAAGASEYLHRILDMGDAADFRGKAKELLAKLPDSAKKRAPAKAKTKPAKVETVLPDENAAPGPATAHDVRAILAQVAADSAKADAASKAAEAAAAKDIPQVEVLPDAPPAGTKPRQVKAFEHVRSATDSMVRIRLTGNVGISRGEVPADADNPKRIFFDLTPAKLPKKMASGFDVGDGVVRRARAGQYDLQTVRVVVELEKHEEPLLQIERDPFELRLSVSLGEQRKEPEPLPKVAAKEPVRAAPRPAALPSARSVKGRLGSNGAPGGVSISQQFGLKVRRIVIDAGHGGKDTGAVGKKGTREKDVALMIAKDVRALIKERLPHIDVIMTRDDDTFIPLEKRTAIANNAGADLFVSIHCNANPSRKIRGVETYYLNITHDRYAIRLAARENSGDAKGISDLQFILADLAMKSNVDDSIRLGRQVQGSLVGRLRQDYSSVQDLGLKHALFYVLMGARMPAILVETSFISNRTEESRLRDAKYRESVADGVVTGIQRFLEERQAFNAQ
jgi:N-acetylmuramoyl-L-alanine amidase